MKWGQLRFKVLTAHTFGELTGLGKVGLGERGVSRFGRHGPSR